MKAFDQSEHDTRIWYHGTMASKACLQAPPPLTPPEATAQLALLAEIFPLTPFFGFFSLNAEPGPRLLSLLMQISSELVLNIQVPKNNWIRKRKSQFDFHQIFPHLSKNFPLGKAFTNLVY